jgi:nucleoid-associated protein YgaU
MRMVMTRENKLALIIGFGLVLVVGILVSDHLSAASRQETADLAADVQPADSKRLRDTALLTPTFPRDRGARQRPADGELGAPIATNGTTAGSQPNDRDATADLVDDMIASAPDASTDTPADPEQGIRIDDIVRADSDIPDEIRNPGQDALIQRDVEEVQERLREASERQIAFTWYTIKAGETLAKIAREKLGDANLWRQLHEINKDRLPNPDVVPSGVTIRLPKRDDLIAATGGRPPAKPADGSPASVPAVRYTTYTVQPGESLSKVAAKFMGSGTKWRELYELNKDVISNPDNLKAGTVLKVPAR